MYLRGRNDADTNDVDTIRAVAPEYGQMRSALLGSCPYWVNERLGRLLLTVEKPWTPRVVQHCVSENCSLCSTELYVQGST